MFEDRAHAGRALAGLLAAHQQPGVRVLALPRGGVPVGFEVARALGAPLDVLVVRKLGMPGHEEYALGAVASGGIRVLNDGIERLGLDDDALDRVTSRELDELARREALYRGQRPPVDVAGRTVIVVDDGLATGATMRAAVRSLRARGPARIIVAVPVSAPEICALLAEEADEVVCASMPERFLAVGQWYRDFAQTTDDEVRTLLALASASSDAPME